MPRSRPCPESDVRAPVALDDPVPSGSSVAIVAPDCVEVQPHAIETAVRKKLSCQRGIQCLELVVRRVPDGVCLEGVVHTDNDSLNIPAIVREIAGVERVINHLLILPSRPVSCDPHQEVAVSV